jgi:hypothetical protein
VRRPASHRATVSGRTPSSAAMSVCETPAARRTACLRGGDGRERRSSIFSAKDAIMVWTLAIPRTIVK